MLQIADFQNDGIPLHSTGMFYQIKSPAATGFLDFRKIIPAFVEEGSCFRTHQPGRSIVEQQVEIRECAREMRSQLGIFSGAASIRIG